MSRSKPKIIHEWQSPEKIAVHDMRELFRQGKTGALRILIFTGALLIALHLFMNKFLPEDFEISFTKAFILIFLFTIGLVCYIYLVCPLIIRYSRYKYKITDEGVNVIGGGQSRVLRWNKITGYILAKHEQVPEISVITICAQDTIRRLYLPEEELAQEIIASVAERLPLLKQVPESLKRIELSKSQRIYLCLFTIIYSVLAAFYMVLAMPKKVGPFVFIVVMIFGPGTLGLSALFGRKLFKNKYLKVYAIVFNMVALGLIMLFSLLFLLYHFSKQMGGR